MENCYFIFENKDKKEVEIDFISKLLRTIEVLRKEGQKVNQKLDIVATCLPGVRNNSEQESF